MPRPCRFFCEGFTHHVIQRGNNRIAMFHALRDYQAFLVFLREAAQRRQVSIHTFALMTTHVHLLATPATKTGLPKMMQDIGRQYVPYFNRRHERSGGLWEGRYRSFPIDSKRYFFTCVRYIESNPVRAGIVSAPGDYRWSSYRNYAFGTPSALITRHPLFYTLGRTDAERQAEYRALCGERLSELELTAIRDSAHHGWPLGGPEFLKVIEEKCATRAVRRNPGRKMARQPTRGWFFDDAQFLP